MSEEPTVFSLSQLAAELSRGYDTLIKVVETNNIQPKHVFKQGTKVTKLYDRAEVEAACVAADEKRKQDKAAQEAQKPLSTLGEVRQKLDSVSQDVADLTEQFEQSGGDVKKLLEQNRLLFGTLTTFVEQYGEFMRESRSRTQVQADQIALLVTHNRQLLDLVADVRGEVKDMPGLFELAVESLREPVARGASKPEEPGEGALSPEAGLTAAIAIESARSNPPPAPIIKAHRVRHVPTVETAPRREPPKIVIIGLVGSQQQPVRQRFGQEFNLEFLQAHDAQGADLRRCLQKTDYAIVLTRVFNSGTENVLKEWGGRVGRVNGSTSGAINLIAQYKEELANAVS